MDSALTTKKAETAAASAPPQPENEPTVCEAASDEKQSTVSAEQKPNSPEQSPEGSQAQPVPTQPVPTRAEEKARQPVVLNPVPHQQVQQPQENKPVSTAEESTNMCQDSAESVEVTLKLDQDLVHDMSGKEPRPITPQPACAGSSSQTAADAVTQSYGTDRTQSPVDSLKSVDQPSGVSKKRFTVRKVEDPVLSNGPSEIKSENNEPVPPSILNTCNNAGTDSETEVTSNLLNKDISRKPESEPNQELCDELVLHDRLSPSQQVVVDKSGLEPAPSSLLDGEQIQISFEVQVSKANGEQLQIVPTTSSFRPQTPTYAFHPVDNSISDCEQAFPRHNVKFESQISGEELNEDKPKVESVVSSDDELQTSAPTEIGVPSSTIREFVQGRFIVSMSNDRPDTPSSETSDQAKPALQTVEITLQDVTSAAGMGSIPSLTPSSSMESLNSVGSQPGVQNMHTFSSSPQTILPDGQGSTGNLAAALNKDPARKNSGPSDLLNDSARQSLGKLEGEQVQNITNKLLINYSMCLTALWLPQLIQ